MELKTPLSGASTTTTKEDKPMPSYDRSLQAPAGGSGGSKFSSGSHPMGVFWIRIECGPFSWEHFEKCQSTIKRVFVEFRSSTGAPSTPTYYHNYNRYGRQLKEKIPSYFGCPCNNPDGLSNRTYTFQLKPGDLIVRADVWTNGQIANAVQFYTKAGIVSPIYGIPKDGSQRVVFDGGEEGENHLVGVYGRFGGVLDSLGFEFRPLKDNHLQSHPGLVVEQEEDSSWFASGDEEMSTMTMVHK